MQYLSGRSDLTARRHHLLGICGGAENNQHQDASLALSQTVPPRWWTPSHNNSTLVYKGLKIGT